MSKRVRERANPTSWQEKLQIEFDANKRDGSTMDGLEREWNKQLHTVCVHSDRNA